MNFQTKLRHALTLFESGKAKSRSAQPWAYRLLWALDIEKTPPHFVSFAENWTFLGLFFGFYTWICMIAIVHFIVGASWLLAFGIFTPAAFAAGILFGYKMARHYEREAQQYGIPLWKDFHPVE